MEHVSSKSLMPNIRSAYHHLPRIDKRFFKAATFKFWAVVVYERQQRFRLEVAQEMVKQFVTACRDVGIMCQDENPIISYQNGQGRIGEVGQFA